MTPEPTNGSKQSPLTLGLALSLFLGVGTILVYSFTISDRFVTKTEFQSGMDLLRAEIGRSAAETRSEIANLRADFHALREREMDGNAAR